MTVDFYAFVQAVEQRKHVLGIVDTPEAVDALRNKGGRRTPAKRDRLGRMRDRALATGRTPVPAYF